MPGTGNRAGALTAEHRRQLEHDSAILPEVLAEEAIDSRSSSLQLPIPDRALRHSNSHKGQHFGQWGETDRRSHAVDLGPGIYFGTRDVSARLAGQYRPDRPRTSINGHVVKYETCRGTRPSFAVPRRCREPLVSSKCTVWITEGYKKALAIASGGACAISLNGVDAWSVKPAPNEPSEPIDDFDAVHWHGRTVWLAYDSDAVEKDGVRWAEQRLTRELEKRGAVVVPIRIPHRPDGSKRGADDYLADRLAAGVSRADALAELTSVALAELLRQTKIPKIPRGGGGDQADCDGSCSTADALRDQVREYKAADELVWRGPFTPAGAQVVKQLLTTAEAARRNGTERVALLRRDLARLAFSDDGDAAEKAVSRALKAYKQYQDDPETAAQLPYRLEWRDGGRRTHIDLVPLTPEAPRSRADELRALGHLPKLERAPAPIRERDDRCPRCHGPEGVEARTTKRCRDDACGHIWSTRPVILGRAESDSASMSNGIESYSGHFVPPELTTPYAGQIVPTNDSPPVVLIPVSMVSVDDLEAAKGPRYWGEAPDEPPAEPPAWTPPPLAPSGHIARGFIRRAPPAAIMGGET